MSILPRGPFCHSFSKTFFEVSRSGNKVETRFHFISTLFPLLKVVHQLVEIKRKHVSSSEPVIFCEDRELLWLATNTSLARFLLEASNVIHSTLAALICFGKSTTPAFKAR